MDRWVVGGLVVQVLGLVVQVTGIKGTWSDYSAGQRYLEPLRVAARWVNNQVRRLPGLRRDAVVHATAHGSGAGVGTVTTTGTAKGLMLPDPSVDPLGFREAIGQQFSLVQRELDRLTQAQAEDRSGLERALKHVHQELVSGLAENSDLTHEVARDGLRLQGVGAFLVAVGIVVQVGSIVIGGAEGE